MLSNFRTPLLLAGAFALLIGFTGPRDASAGLLAVVGDVNAAGNSNFPFYDAVLGASQDILFSRNDAQQGNLNTHFQALGRSVTESGAALTGALLGGFDMLVVTRIFNNAFDYTAAEITAAKDFIEGGGTILMIAEADIGGASASYETFLTGIGSSIDYVSRISSAAVLTNQPSPLGPLPDFTVSAYNTLNGGTSVYQDSAGRTVVALELLPPNAVPEPATLLLLGGGLLGFARLRRRV